MISDRTGVQIMTQTEDYKRELISILFVQKHLIFWVALAVFAGAVLVASFWPSSYQASGEVLVSGKQLSAPNPEALGSPSVSPREISKEDLTSELQILQSRELARRTLFALRSHPKFSLEPQSDVSDDVVGEAVRPQPRRTRIPMFDPRFFGDSEPVPEANPRPERPKGSPCLDLPPRISPTE